MPEVAPSRTRIEILGREYQVRGHRDPAYMARIARYVDGKIREILKRSSSPSATKAAVLAALNIADELHRERAEKRQLLEKAQFLHRLLEEGSRDGDS